ncbi:MAG: hypothetical protein APF80_10135 [Alphaproteobacteria bacterium BRH_c36]|nr:MAG: hypothetical protein APF80_10135 [Alphaproteobacteria bacterium BRH_c36]
MTSYDPEARRDTPLALRLKQQIRDAGPIPIGDYMRICLQDTSHGYYRHKPAIGRGGDFITAPEISQTFGELIGLWTAVVWQQMGSPSRFNFIELGPGRGTLMRDAIRAAHRVPGFLLAANIVLVDIAAHQIELNFAALAANPILMLERISDIPADAPAIVVANEFLDTRPVQQFQVTDADLLMRGVGLADDRLIFVTMPRADELDDDASLFAANPGLAEGAIFEAQDWTVLHRLADRLCDPWAALFIDYGQYDPDRSMDKVVTGDTLQAVRGHRYEDPLTSPGEADLTCQVDFNDVKLQFEAVPAEGCRRHLVVDGPITQCEFLGRLGIVERASRLMSANPAKAAEIEAGIMRLMSPQGMGTRFKAIGVRSSNLPVLPGFE